MGALIAAGFVTLIIMMLSTKARAATSTTTGQPMSASLQATLNSALGSTDPQKILAAAVELEKAGFSDIAKQLQQMAAHLQQNPQAPIPTSPAAPPATPGAPPAPPASSQQIDAILNALPDDLRQEVQIGLDSVNQPATLRIMANYADEAGYHDAAALLRAKADTIESGKSVPTPPAVPVSTTGTPVSTQAQKFPGSDYPFGYPSKTYGPIKGDGSDIPWRIAQRITGDATRWPELCHANPKLPTDPVAGCRYNPGDILQLPASWVESNAGTTVAVSGLGRFAPPSTPADLAGWSQQFGGRHAA